MKRCPTCKRTFEDTLTYCLVDGAILDAPYDPHETLVIPEPKQTEPPPTEILPIAETREEIPPTVAIPQPEKKSHDSASTIAAPAFESPKVEASPAQTTRQSSRLPLILVGVGVLLIIGLIYFIVSNRTGGASENLNKAKAENNSTSDKANNQTSTTNQLHIEIMARGKDVWIEVKADDDIKGKGFIVKPDDPPMKFDPAQRLVIRYAQVNADALKVTINGRQATVPANQTEMLITRGNYTDFTQH